MAYWDENDAWWKRRQRKASEVPAHPDHVPKGLTLRFTPVRCPNPECKESGGKPVTYRTIGGDDGPTMRYHRCERCGSRWSTVEEHEA